MQIDFVVMNVIIYNKKTFDFSLYTGVDITCYMDTPLIKMMLWFSFITFITLLYIIYRLLNIYTNKCKNKIANFFQFRNDFLLNSSVLKKDK
jgi:hypothetical protein